MIIWWTCFGFHLTPDSYTPKIWGGKDRKVGLVWQTNRINARVGLELGLYDTLPERILSSELGGDEEDSEEEAEEEITGEREEPSVKLKQEAFKKPTLKVFKKEAEQSRKEKKMSVQPTFSGEYGEDVELFINQCRFTWSGVGLDDGKKNLAIATTMMSGLRGTALRFGKVSVKNERMDGGKLAEKLRERFPEQERAEETQNILIKIALLK